MEFIEIIRKRRSIRKYVSGKIIPQRDIELILEAAMLSPSANNTRPWEFVVVKSRDVLDRLSEVHQYAKMLKTASIAVIVCALPEMQKDISTDYFPQDCGAATQSILLQATALGYGSCWCGVYPRENLIADVQNALGIKSLPFNIIAIGVPDEDPAPRGYFDEKKVRYM